MFLVPALCGNAKFRCVGHVTTRELNVNVNNSVQNGIDFSNSYFYTFICCNCSMKKFVNFHLKSFMKDNSKQTHLCYDIFAHLKDFGQGGLNGLLHFVT